MLSTAQSTCKFDFDVALIVYICSRVGHARISHERDQVSEPVSIEMWMFDNVTRSMPWICSEEGLSDMVRSPPSYP
jgi:hypothetical protein